MSAWIVAAVWSVGVADGCGGAQTAGAQAASAPVPRDVHGEPLELMPPDPLLYVRLAAAEARASQHWGVIRALLDARAAETVAVARRELGGDPLQTAEVLALALYAPPGMQATAENHGWPVLYVRGPIDREAILAAARSRATATDPLTQRTQDGLEFPATHERAYLFLAPDVLIICDPVLVARISRQLSGEERSSVTADIRFTALWGQADGRGGTLQAAADGAALRAIVDAAQTGDESVRSLDRAVLRVDAANEVRIRFAAYATNDAAAQQLVVSIDAIRQTLLHRFDVRLMMLSRLLNQGVTDVSEGRLVRVRVDAHADETARILRAAQLLPN